MDVLSDVLTTIRLHSAIHFCPELSAPWGIQVSAQRDRALFYVLSRGSCYLEVDGLAAPVPLVGGDVAMLPHGAAHIVRDQCPQDEWRVAASAAAWIVGHVGKEIPPWRKLMAALGFLIAAVHYRIQDATDLAWIPVEAILKSRALSNIFFIAPTATAAVVIFHHDGIPGVINSAEGISAVGATFYGLVRVGRWWRGVKPPDPKPRRSNE